jgi:hypothetical protein
VELLPDAQDPATGEYYRDILASLPDQGVKLFRAEKGES